MTTIDNLNQRVQSALSRLNIEEKKKRISELEEATQTKNFWDDQKKAQAVFDELKSLQKTTENWQLIKDELDDLIELEKELDESIQSDWERGVEKLEEKVKKAEVDLFLNREYDQNPAILTLWAGTGGTDAQDWTAMLLRMYLRFCQQMGWKTEIISEQSGDEAGLKSVVVEISGENAYGYLRRERGTHRLIRLSPFNAKNLRQTSFAGVEITPLIEKTTKIDLDEKDLKIDTYRSSGAGGQHVNTTDSAVRITHIPTNIVVTCQSGRSQLQNRQKAVQVLMGKLLAKKLEEDEKELNKARGGSFSADFGGQIRTITLHPYQQVKDHRINFEVSQTDKYLDGDILAFIEGAMRGGF